MLWLILSLAAATFSGVAVVVEKRALLKEHAMEFCTVFSILLFLVTLVVLPKVNFAIQSKSIMLVYFAAALASLAFLFEAKGIRHMEVSIASPLLAFGPVATLIIAVIFLNEKISTINILGVLLIIGGAYFLETHTLSVHFIEPLRKLFSHRHTLYLFFSMLIYAAAVVINKYLLGSIDVCTFIFFYHLFIMINLIILIHTFHDGFKGIRHGMRNAGKWIFLVAGLAFVVRLLYYNALNLHRASIVYPVIKTDTLFATIVGGALFHDNALLVRSFSCLIMLIGVFLVVI